MTPETDTIRPSKFKRYYSPMLDSIQFDQVMPKPDPVTKQEADRYYIAYLESTTELQAARIIALEKALTTSLIKLNKENVDRQLGLRIINTPPELYDELLAILRNHV